MIDSPKPSLNMECLQFGDSLPKQLLESPVQLSCSIQLNPIDQHGWLGHDIYSSSQAWALRLQPFGLGKIPGCVFKVALGLDIYLGLERR